MRNDRRGKRRAPMKKAGGPAKRMVGQRVAVELLERLDAIADRTNETKSSLLARLLTDALAREEARLESSAA